MKYANTVVLHRMQRSKTPLWEVFYNGAFKGYLAVTAQGNRIYQPCPGNFSQDSILPDGDLNSHKQWLKENVFREDPT